MMDDQAVSSLRSGELGPGELASLAGAATADPEGREALYDGLRTTVAGLLRAHAEERECNEWGEVLTHLSGMARAASEDDPGSADLLAARLDTLRDLSADAAAYQRFNSIERIGEFPLYKAMIRHLESQGGSAPRASLVREFGLTESNATRVLKLLESACLLRRARGGGGGVEVSLRPEGRRLLRQWTLGVETGDGKNVLSMIPMLRAREGIDGVPQATVGWPAKGRRTG